MDSRVADALGALWRSRRTGISSMDEDDIGDVVDSQIANTYVDDIDALQRREAGPGPSTQAQRRLLGRLSSTPALPSTPQATSQIYQCPPRDRPLYAVRGKAILVHATDADSAFWPTTFAAKVDQPFWYSPVDDIDKRQATWRRRAGQALARELHLDNPKDDWDVAAWPAGYKMFVQHSTSNPDAYFVHVSGSSIFQHRRRFKTAKEFGKHLAWLCQYGQDITATCTCKHCLVVSQRSDTPPRPIVIRRIATPPHVWQTLRAVQQKQLSSTKKPVPTFLDQAKSLAGNITDAAKSTAKAILSAVTTAPVRSKAASIAAQDMSAKQRKRKRRSVSTSEFELDLAGDDIQPTEVDVNGRPKRSTRYVKSMKDLTPPPRRKAKTPDPAEKRPAPKPVVIPLPVWPGAFVNRERHADLASRGGWMRKYEVVWHRLGEPFVCQREPSFNITHWPALVVERRIDAEATMLHLESTETAHEIAPVPQLRVKQRGGCMVRLLATRTIIYSSHKRTIPYLAYTPHDLMHTEIYAYLREYKDKPSFSDLHDWKKAITPWVLARQIVVYLKESWTLVDPYWRPTEYDRLKKMIVRSKSSNAENRARMEIAEQETAIQSIYWGCEKIWSGELVRLHASWGVRHDGSAVICLSDGQQIALEHTALSANQETRQVLFKISAIVRDPRRKDVSLHGKFMQLVEVSELEDGERRLPTQADAVFQRVLELEPHAYYREQHLPRVANLREYRPLLRFNDEEHALDEKIPLALLAGRHYQIKRYFVDMASQIEVQQARALGGRYFSRSSGTPATRWQPSRETALKHAYRRGRSDVQQYFLENQVSQAEHNAGRCEDDPISDVTLGYSDGVGKQLRTFV